MDQRNLKFCWWFLLDYNLICRDLFGKCVCGYRGLKGLKRYKWIKFKNLGNWSPAPPLIRHFALGEKQVLMFPEGRGVGQVVSQKPKLISQSSA